MRIFNKRLRNIVLRFDTFIYKDVPEHNLLVLGTHPKVLSSDLQAEASCQDMRDLLLAPLSGQPPRWSLFRYGGFVA